ncbi:hypothetical protein EVAR_92412_1 [Eumeta japonica]|uniref:Uncharacterized protein n=1 Tax=Eumeta variegata TaxID=151549 RepID=A0A4C1T6U2_EUMVA|nr:hypothetical protein EVAR_92412_1 [Eumeta japonica]
MRRGVRDDRRSCGRRVENFNRANSPKPQRANVSIHGTEIIGFLKNRIGNEIMVDTGSSVINTIIIIKRGKNSFHIHVGEAESKC